MEVTIDRLRERVLMTGKAFEVELTWSQALNLGTLLIEKSGEVEPVAPPGKSYRPVTER